jgi:hypothetical protein
VRAPGSGLEELRQHALGSFAADEIVILPSPDGDDQWAEKNLFEQVKRRFDLPVREIQLEEGAPGAHAEQTASSPAGSGESEA